MTDTSSRRLVARPSSSTLLRSIAVGLLACASAPVLAAAPYSRVLVVGVSPDDNYRCQFEQFLADQMQSGAIEAVAFVGLLCFVVVWIVVAVRSATAVLRIARSA